MDIAYTCVFIQFLCFTANVLIPASCTGVYQSSKWNEAKKKLTILILTIPGSGHTAVPLALGEELVRRGHQVTLVSSDSQLAAATQRVGIKYRNRGSMDLYNKFFEASRKGQTVDDPFVHLQVLPTLRVVIKYETDQFISFIKEELLSGTRWDAILSTDFLEAFLPCVGEMLQIPAISLRNTLQITSNMFPLQPFPTLLANGDTDDMTFVQRVKSTFEVFIAPHMLSYLFLSPIIDTINTYCPALSNKNLASTCSITLPEIVPTVMGFEYSRSLSPLSHYVGPILTEYPEPLTGELEAWLNSKQDNSVIYISMGSVTLITKELSETIVKGIKRTNYSIVWSLRKTEDFELDIEPQRIFTSKWLPQLAVLRNKAVGMAILHGGCNGVHESLHSGVPLIILPGMLEQTYNAGRAHGHRLGIHLNKHRLTADQIYKSIVEIDSGDYRENVAKLQKVFRQAGGAKRAADLVEFYSEVGYDHLIPAYAKYHWSWVQYYNVDVYVLLLVCALITVYIPYRIFKCACSRCYASRKQKME